MIHYIYLFLWAMSLSLATSPYPNSNTSINTSCIYDAGGCCVPIDPSLPCVTGLDGCCIRIKMRKPRCDPGERAKRINDPACEGKGYHADMACTTCGGCRQIWKTKYVDPYTRTKIGDFVRCPVCCGTGMEIHRLCKGKGWIWECESTDFN